MGWFSKKCNACGKEISDEEINLEALEPEEVTTALKAASSLCGVQCDKCGKWFHNMCVKIWVSPGILWDTSHAICSKCSK
jgi:hypothetical protein